MKFFSKTFIFFLILASSLLLPASIPAHAQLNVGLSPADISTDVEPTNPGPFQQISVTIDSYATDLNGVSISWVVNGKKVVSGIGKKGISLTTGAIGKQTSINITIDSITGTITKNITIIPATVDMIWEANTYTPPFFKGKAIFSPESVVTFVAIPHLIRNGVEVSPKNLIYTWSNNGTVLGSQSGYGKSTLSIAGSIIPRPFDITVEASDPNTGSVADGETVLASQTPFVLFYKNDPLYGVQYEHALTGVIPLTTQEMEITAVPYYFSARSMFDNLLSYNWEINGTPIGDGINSPDKVFRRTGTAVGQSNVSVSTTQSATMFQTANQAVTIDFQNSSTQVGL